MSPRDRATAAYEALVSRPFLSPQETADVLGIHVNTVLRAIEAGELRAGTISKRRRRDGRPAGPYRVLFTDAEAWLYGDAAAPEDPPPVPVAARAQAQAPAGPAPRRRPRTHLVTA